MTLSFALNFPKGYQLDFCTLKGKNEKEQSSLQNKTKKTPITNAKTKGDIISNEATTPCINIAEKATEGFVKYAILKRKKIKMISAWASFMCSKRGLKRGNFLPTNSIHLLAPHSKCCH